MKQHHHCQCGFKKHLAKFQGKKLGLVGITLFGLHILWHVAECLILPSILVAFGGKVIGEEVAANGNINTITVAEAEHLLKFIPLRSR